MLPSSLGEIHPFVLALFVLAAGLMLRRIALRRRRGRTDSIGDARKILVANQQTAEARLNAHEVRLHDVAREAEARLRTKMAVMDEMVAQADQEIARLEQLLEEIQDIPTPRLAGSGEEDLHERIIESSDVSDVDPDQFIRLLRQSGYNAQEISNANKRPLEEIRRILGEPDEGSSQAA